MHQYHLRGRVQARHILVLSIRDGLLFALILHAVLTVLNAPRKERE